MKEEIVATTLSLCLEGQIKIDILGRLDLAMYTLTGTKQLEIL